MKKILFLSISIFLFASPVFNQVQLTQYFMDGTYYNPAVSGSQDAICGSLFARQQWMGMTDTQGNKLSPLSMVFNLHAPTYSISSGIGLNVVYDNPERENNLGIRLNYAYHKSFQNESKLLSFGIGISMLNKTINYDQFNLEQPGDPLLQYQQPETGKMMDIDLGIHYRQNKKIYAGISMSNILGSTTDIGNVQYGQSRFLYATAGYYIKIIEKRKQQLYVIPSLLIKSNLVNMQIDISARAEYNNLMAGLSYRYQDALAVMAGVNLKGFRLGLSYDLTTGSLSEVSNGSPEIFVAYCYKIAPKVKLSSLYNTRYL